MAPCRGAARRASSCGASHSSSAVDGVLRGVLGLGGGHGRPLVGAARVRSARPWRRNAPSGTQRSPSCRWRAGDPRRGGTSTRPRRCGSRGRGPGSGIPDAPRPRVRRSRALDAGTRRTGSQAGFVVQDSRRARPQGRRSQGSSTSCLLRHEHCRRSRVSQEEGVHWWSFRSTSNPLSSPSHSLRSMPTRACHPSLIHLGHRGRCPGSGGDRAPKRGWPGRLAAPPLTHHPRITPASALNHTPRRVAFGRRGEVFLVTTMPPNPSSSGPSAAADVRAIDVQIEHHGDSRGAGESAAHQSSRVATLMHPAVLSSTPQAAAPDPCH